MKSSTNITIIITSYTCSIAQPQDSHHHDGHKCPRPPEAQNVNSSEWCDWSAMHENEKLYLSPAETWTWII